MGRAKMEKAVCMLIVLLHCSQTTWAGDSPRGSANFWMTDNVWKAKIYGSDHESLSHISEVYVRDKKLKVKFNGDYKDENFEEELPPRFGKAAQEVVVSWREFDDAGAAVAFNKEINNVIKVDTTTKGQINLRINPRTLGVFAPVSVWKTKRCVALKLHNGTNNRIVFHELQHNSKAVTFNHRGQGLVLEKHVVPLGTPRTRPQTAPAGTRHLRG